MLTHALRRDGFENLTTAPVDGALIQSLRRLCDLGVSAVYHPFMLRSPQRRRGRRVYAEKTFSN